MSEKKYVAYVGSYTHGSSRQGIHVYDVDVENGTLTERSSVEVSNASHMAVSKNGKYIYYPESDEHSSHGDGSYALQHFRVLYGIRHPSGFQVCRPYEYVQQSPYRHDIRQHKDTYRQHL